MEGEEAAVVTVARGEPAAVAVGMMAGGSACPLGIASSSWSTPPGARLACMLELPAARGSGRGDGRGPLMRTTSTSSLS